MPVSAEVQPWQVPVHAMSQQTALAQKPLVHWSTPVHEEPPGSVAVQVPPCWLVSRHEPVAQSVSTAHAVQTSLSQYALAQSRGSLHPVPSLHGAQLAPPQSMPVSSPSWTPSVQ